ncbi:MAG: endo-1,4-beta-xylanase [Bacteroidaceae bacterium]|nr:endo-1,4-beta-xylanase [Bacteroidaceae bacterium]
MKKIILLSAFCILQSALSFAQNWKVGNPNDPNYAYLKEYKNLKDYVDRKKYPNFKTALALGANDYINNTNMRGLADANFEELVTGNEMKMASCVNNSGTMNFNTVKNFVNKATAAGHVIYGHTLAWHAQQPRGWLLSLMKDHPAQPIEGADTESYQEFYNKDFRTQQNIGWHADFKENNYEVSYDATNGMKVTVTKKAPQNYYVQYWAASDIPATKGEKCKMIITMKGSKAGYTYARVGDWDGNCPNKNINFTTEWQDYEWEVTPTISNPGVLLQHGDFVGDLYIKQIRFEKVVMGKTVTEDRRCLAIDATAYNASNAGLEDFDTQLNIKCGSFSKFDTYKLTLLVRADKRTTISTTIGDIPVTNSWKTVTLQGSFNYNGSLIVLPLSALNETNKFYFDDISFEINGVEKIVNGDFSGDVATSFAVKQGVSRPKAPAISESITYLLLPTPTPQTAEEKHDTLVYAMDKWIKGMMEACDGKVRAWDLVNEAISGGDNDGDGIYDLQHDWELKDDGGFWWQDFMGDLEYVRQACRLARKYGPSDIKLFINDYNLESDWDDNKKLKSLIEWIKRWEADGVTHIDGIGTQMHISCSMNPSTLASRRKHIRQMFELMAASGKLVRVSELDMGMDDANNKGVQTANMTEEMHKMMADHYEYIIKTYFEVVPPEQQWGICQWCATDSPSNSGWRANTPVGLWTLNNYYRKHTYAGWAIGLGADPNNPSATAIEDAIVEKQPVSNAPVYSINGQLLGNDFNSLPAGLYIRDGKKVIKK